MSGSEQVNEDVWSSIGAGTDDDPEELGSGASGTASDGEPSRGTIGAEEPGFDGETARGFDSEDTEDGDSLTDRLMSTEPDPNLGQVDPIWSPEKGGMARVARGIQKASPGDTSGIPAVVDIALGLGEFVWSRRAPKPGASDPEDSSESKQSPQSTESTADTGPLGAEGGV